jgi:spermidine synthase
VERGLDWYETNICANAHSQFYLLFLSQQAETMHLPADLQGAAQWRQQALQIGFERVRYGTISIATYPTGQIGFMMCEKKAADPIKLQDRYRSMVKAGHATTYYHPPLQER